MNFFKLLAPAPFICLSFCSSGQSLTGIWKGYFITKDRSHYKIELQVKESQGLLSGVTYSYLNTEYYGKATLTGNTDKKHLSISIQEIKTVEVRTTEGSISCLMNYTLSYSRSGKEEYLEGNFTSKYETGGEQVKKGSDCGGGTVFLRRVAVSDFYTEPFLNNSASVKKVYINEAPPPKNKIAATTPPNPNKTAAKPIAPTPTKKPATGNISTRKPVSAVTPKPTDLELAKTTSKDEETSSLEKTASPPTIEQAKSKSLPIPVANDRLNELVKEIVITTNQVTISIYDNGEIDGDTLSVYLNGEVVLSNKRLSTTPLQLSIKLEESRDIQELTFVAENLGRIPPNTALMIIDTGKQQYRLQVLSTDKKNAVFRFLFRPRQ